MAAKYDKYMNQGDAAGWAAAAEGGAGQEGGASQATAWGSARPRLALP